MPAEFLRDVVRPPAKRSRAWSMLPASLVAHAAGALAIVIIPLAAEEPPPPPASPVRALNIMAVRPVPPARAPAGPAARRAPTAGSTAAPLVAASSITDEQRAPSGPPDGAPGGVGFEDGVSSGLSAGDSVAPPLPPPPPLVRPEPVRVRGGDIREPQKVRHVAPIYPPIAVSSQVEGVVILEATIDETGSIENLRVLKSHPLLERAAIEAVREWRYTPTRLNGVPVPVIMTVTVRFTLQR